MYPGRRPPMSRRRGLRGSAPRRHRPRLPPRTARTHAGAPRRRITGGRGPTHATTRRRPAAARRRSRVRPRLRSHGIPPRTRRRITTTASCCSSARWCCWCSWRRACSCCGWRSGCTGRSWGRPREAREDRCRVCRGDRAYRRCGGGRAGAGHDHRDVQHRWTGSGAAMHLAVVRHSRDGLVGAWVNPESAAVGMPARRLQDR
jgi:hypothetical protein